MVAFTRPLKNLIKSVYREEKTEEKHQEPPPVLRAELQVPPAVVACYEASQEKDDRHKKLQLLMEFVGIVLLLFTLRANWKAATAAKNAADTAADTLGFTRESTHLDQRAWVTVVSLVTHPPVPEVGQTFRISINFTNSGKTPALNILSTTVADPVPKGGQPNFSYTNDPVAHVGLIAPNGYNFAELKPARSRSTGNESPLTQAIIDEIKREDTRIYVHGHLTYNDVFGKSHWLDFCYYLTAPDLTSFSVCKEHNETGDYQESAKTS